MKLIIFKHNLGHRSTKSLDVYIANSSIQKHRSASALALDDGNYISKTNCTSTSSMTLLNSNKRQLASSGTGNKIKKGHKIIINFNKSKINGDLMVKCNSATDSSTDSASGDEE